jgi:hypothetical protein
VVALECRRTEGRARAGTFKSAVVNGRGFPANIRSLRGKEGLTALKKAAVRHTPAAPSRRKRVLEVIRRWLKRVVAGEFIESLSSFALRRTSVVSMNLGIGGGA